MKKFLIGLSVIAVLLVSLVAINEVVAKKEDTSEEVETRVGTSDDPRLPYLRKARYPTAEEAAMFRIHAGQFPLENECKCIPLHNFNED
ncbi:hypothetical protein [Rossellomorea marisflavi]|uniref:hypothetical protein n=1 Tax=Rossellomorea marisflavi TaxID=189381 RepID=UPI00345D7809